MCLFAVCNECVINYLKEDSFAVCPSCANENRALPSKRLKECKEDKQFDLIIKNLLKNIDIATKEASVSTQLIENYCVCAICLDVLKNTAVANCLHRFCRDCIVKSMGVNSICKNKCPLCKQQINSCRSLRSDELMDILIEQYTRNKTKNVVNNKLWNGCDRLGLQTIFELIIKAVPKSLRSINDCHPDIKMFVKTATPHEVTGD